MSCRMLAACLLVVAALVPSAAAQNVELGQPAARGEKVQVGLLQVPPFAVKDAQGRVTHFVALLRELDGRDLHERPARIA